MFHPLAVKPATLIDVIQQKPVFVLLEKQLNLTARF
jgi:hypothetical protein